MKKQISAVWYVLVAVLFTVEAFGGEKKAPVACSGIAGAVAAKPEEEKAVAPTRVPAASTVKGVDATIQNTTGSPRITPVQGF